MTGSDSVFLNSRGQTSITCDTLANGFLCSTDDGLAQFPVIRGGGGAEAVVVVTASPLDAGGVSSVSFCLLDEGSLAVGVAHMPCAALGPAMFGGAAGADPQDPALGRAGLWFVYLESGLRFCDAGTIGCFEGWRPPRIGGSVVTVSFDGVASRLTLDVEGVSHVLPVGARAGPLHLLLSVAGAVRVIAASGLDVQLACPGDCAWRLSLSPPWAPPLHTPPGGPPVAAPPVVACLSPSPPAAASVREDAATAAAAAVEAAARRGTASAMRAAADAIAARDGALRALGDARAALRTAEAEAHGSCAAAAAADAAAAAAARDRGAAMAQAARLVHERDAAEARAGAAEARAGAAEARSRALAHDLAACEEKVCTRACARVRSGRGGGEPVCLLCIAQRTCDDDMCVRVLGSVCAACGEGTVARATVMRRGGGHSGTERTHAQYFRGDGGVCGGQEGA